LALLCSGSVAIDHIMVFRGRFKDVILPDKIHVLNVAFHVPELRRSFGGTAANIAFNLRLLGESPLVLATVGHDFEAYARWLDTHGIRREGIRELAGEVTAGAYITTDLDDNQIVGFHAGAMDRAHEVRVEDVAEPIELAIVSPNGKRAMIEHARALKAGGVPTVIDPGQGLPLFEREELVELLTGADTYVVNDYEWSLTLETTGLSEGAIEERVGTVIVTLGERGSELRHAGERQPIPPVRAAQVVDPTGCGDAFRAGYLHGRRLGLPRETCARIGSVMGSLLVEREGTQSLSLAPGELQARYERAFGAPYG
jgi:adenosine kinase